MGNEGDSMGNRGSMGNREDWNREECGNGGSIINVGWNMGNRGVHGKCGRMGSESGTWENRRA